MTFESRDVRFREDIFPFQHLNRSDPLFDYELDDPSDRTFDPTHFRQTRRSYPGISDDEEEFDFENSLSQAASPDEVDPNTTQHDTSANSSPTSSSGGSNDDCGTRLSSDTTFAQRRSIRNRKRQDFGVFVDSSCINAMLTQTDRHTNKIPIPRSINEALHSPFHKEWKAAIESELTSHRDNGTWTLVDAPAPGRSIIGAMWVFRVNYNQNDGSVERFKARLVARGDSQKPGADFSETYAPVARFASFRLLMAISAHLDLELEHIDITTAYLYGDIDREIYMRQPPGCKISGQENKVCKLLKSIYGLKQAGRIWNNLFHSFLLSCNFNQCLSDECLYVSPLPNGKRLFVLIYVDDVIIATNSKTALDALKTRIQQKFKVKINGPLKCFLNIEINRDRLKRKIYLSQEQYTTEILEQMGMLKCNPSPTPEIPNSRLHAGLCPETVEEANFMRKIGYRQAVGSLQYLASKTRPDIAHAVQQVAQFCANPGKKHWDAIKYIFRYLNSSKNFGIEYCGSSQLLHAYFGQGATNIPPAAMFADSDWANDLDKRKSVGGYAFMMYGGVIDYNCKKFTDTPLSSTEAEWYAACEAAKNGLMLRNLLVEIGLPMSSPLIIFEDNQGCISYGTLSANQSSMRHIALKYHWLRQEIKRETISLEHFLRVGHE